MRSWFDVGVVFITLVEARRPGHGGWHHLLSLGLGLYDSRVEMSAVLRDLFALDCDCLTAASSQLDRTCSCKLNKPFLS